MGRCVAYTLAEIIIVLVVISVVVACTMRVAKTRLDNITTYTYYSAYNILNDATSQMLADFNPNQTNYTDVAFLKMFFFLPIPQQAFAKILKPADMYKQYENCNGYEDCRDKIFRADTVYYYRTRSMYYDKFQDFLTELEYKVKDNKVIACPGKYKDTYNGYTMTCDTGYSSDYPYPDVACNRSCGNLGSAKNCGSEKYNCASDDPNYSSSCDDSFLGDHNIGGTVIDKASFGLPGMSGFMTNDFSPDFSIADTRVKTNGSLEYVVGHNSDVRAGYMLDVKSLGHGICRYKVRCRIDTVPSNAKYPSDFGILSNLTHGCRPNCPQGTEWVDASGTTEKEGYDGPGCYSEEDCPVQECESGMVWKGEPTCACVAEPATIPRKGLNFCKLFVSLVNTKAGTTCTGSPISADTTDFSVDGITADFTLRNGMKVYNASQNPTRIADLVGNTDVGTVTKADGTQIKTNEWGYVLYIDIDGTSGDSKLWEDVYPFYVTLSGRVIPAYKTDNASDYNLYGGGSRYYLQTSIQVDTSDASGSRQYWLANSKSISFRESACRSGYVGANTNYCKRGTPIGQNGTCASESSSCTIKKVSPIRVF